MVKITVMYGKPFETTWQEKSFKDKNACVEWCRRNSEKIGCINNYRTGFRPISHYDVEDAIRGVDN